MYSVFGCSEFEPPLYLHKITNRQFLVSNKNTRHKKYGTWSIYGWPLRVFFLLQIRCRRDIHNDFDVHVVGKCQAWSSGQWADKRNGHITLVTFLFGHRPTEFLPLSGPSERWCWPSCDVAQPCICSRGGGSIRPNPDGRINKNQTAKNNHKAENIPSVISTRYRSTVAQMAERATQDRKVPSSIPAWIQENVFLNITRNDGYLLGISQRVNWRSEKI